MNVLLKKGRASIYPSVVEEFRQLIDRYKKRIHADTTTAVGMEENLYNRLKTALDKKFGADVDISNSVDPGILGGIIVNIFFLVACKNLLLFCATQCTTAS